MIEITWTKGFWLKSVGSALVGVVLILGLMYATFTPTVTLEEANESVEGEDYSYRIIEDRHHKNAYKYSLYMPQMLFGGQWHDMDDDWTTSKDDAKELIKHEQEKQAIRQLPRYVIVDTIQ